MRKFNASAVEKIEERKFLCPIGNPIGKSIFVDMSSIKAFDSSDG